MAESGAGNAAEVVRATPPPSAGDAENGVDTDTVGSKKDRKSHTPASLSRTQLPPSATPEERASLEKLKQKMDFGDDANSPTNSPPKSPQLASNDNSPVEIKKKGFEGNENGEMSEGEIDTSASVSHVLSRLDQVRHYLEEANGLYKAFQSQESLKPADQVQMLKLSNLIKHFKEQELGYLTLLQRIINFEQDGDGESGEEETTTAELNTTHDTLASSAHSDDDQQPLLSSSAPTLPTMGKTRPNANDSLSLQSELDRSRGDMNESDLSQEEELAVLKEQHALLTRLLLQQKELQQLEARQANLRALKQEAENTLAAARIEMQQAHLHQRQQPRALVAYDHTSSTSEDTQSNDEPQVVELETGMAEMSMDENTGPHSLAALVDEEAEKAALMAKLDDLETRKARIDQLLTQLRSLQSAESDSVPAASAAPMRTVPPAAVGTVPPAAVASVPSDDWLATIDDPVLRERIRQLQIRKRSDQQQLQQQTKDEEVYEVAESVQQDNGPSEVVDTTREKDLEEKMRKLEEAREQLKRLQGAIASYQDMMSEDTGQDNTPANQAEDGSNDDDELNQSLVADYQSRLSHLRQEVNGLLHQREALLDTQRMVQDFRQSTSASTAAAAAPSHTKPTASAGYPPTAAAMGGENVGGQLSVELMRQKQLYDELVKKTQLLHQLQSSATRGAVGSEHDTYSVTSSMRGVSTVEGGALPQSAFHQSISHCSGDMTMATWGGSTAQSVDSNEGESDEGEYDNNYEGDTTLQHTGDSAALEESEQAAYTVDDVPFRVDRHTPRRRLLTPDSGMVNSSGKKIKLDSQPRAKFSEPDPTSKYSNPEWVRPVSPRRRYRQPEREVELQQQLVASTNMCNDLLRSQLQLVDVLTYRLNTQMPAYPLGLMQYYDNYHQQLMQYHAYLHDVYQKNQQQSFSQQQQQNDQGATEQPLDSAMPGQAVPPPPPPVGSFGVDGQGINMAPGFPFADGSSSSLYPNPSQGGQYPANFPGAPSNNTSFNNQSFNMPPPPPAPIQNIHMSPYPPCDPHFGFYNSPFLARVPGITPQHYPWSPLRAYTSPMRPFEMPPPFRGSPVFHFGRAPMYGPGMEAQFNVQAHTSQPVTVYPPPQSPSGITAASAQAVAPSTPSARSVSTLQQQQDLNGQQDQGGLLETGPPFSNAMPNGNASLFQTTASNHPTTASVTFGVPTLASMTHKDSTGLKPAVASSRSAGLTAAYVRSTQTKLEEADSESSMPCSLPDDIANRYARADAMGTVSGSATAAATAAAAAMNEDLEEEFSLFEALRDSIYSEVATLISNNESRPHFLIELFRELQLLKTDYLRQRALYSIQDLVTRFLTEENLTEEASNPYLHWVESGTDQTPSDSLVTSDDEVNKGKAPQAGVHDYSEPAESATTLSTPPVEPFASDNLGDTVIHLDISKSHSKDSVGTQPLEQGMSTNTDDTSDSSKSDAFSTENISTQALDQQIKNIMIEVIPLLKNHLQSPCSTEFLANIQQFIMNLALKEEDQQMEYVQVFTVQLSETLTKTLAKYTGKLLKDCGEELLIDVSEVLFNEMAFLKLMEDVANHPDADILGLPLAQVVESKSPEKSSCTTAVLQNLASTAMKQLHLEEEELGKDRDDDLANQCEFPAVQELSMVAEAEISGDGVKPSASDAQHGKEPVATEGKPQGEDMTQTTTEEDTSCKSNSTIEPATEPTENAAVANDNKPNLTGNNKNDDDQVQSDPPADVAQTDSQATQPVDGKEDVAPDSDTDTTNLDKDILKSKMEEEQKTTTGLAGVLASMPTNTALAGNGDSIKEPTETEP